MAGDRTEQASQQRRDKARKDGDLLHSRELSAAAGTLAGVMTLGSAAPRFMTAWREAFAGFLALGAGDRWEPANLAATEGAMRSLGMHVLAPFGLVGASVAAAAMIAGVVQTGGVQIHPQLIAFKADRLNPLSNAKNVFSMRSASRLGKSLIPDGFLAVFAVQRVVRQWHIPPFSLTRMTLVAQDGYSLLTTAAWLLFGWALVDYLVEWRSRESRLKMSRQEMREEYKESEGNPQIRGRIRNLQRQARRRRVKADVSKAAVVITNPTHYAVALAFDFEVMDAPKVVAKGRNLLAEEIKEQARWAGVPILENPPLARSLYKAVEVGDSIPVELYAAVASILAFLYRQRVEEQMRVRRARTHPGSSERAQPVEPPAPVLRSTLARRGTGPERGPNAT